jgi:hypothetical protein
MKLRIINNTYERHISKPAKLRFNTKGTLTINKPGLTATGYKEGDRIMLLQDEDRPNDFYLIKTDKVEFSTLRKAGGGTSAVANYTQGYKELVKQFDIPAGKSFDVNFGGQIKTEFGSATVLITAPLIEIKRKAEQEGASNG